MGGSAESKLSVRVITKMPEHHVNYNAIFMTKRNLEHLWHKSYPFRAYRYNPAVAPFEGAYAALRQDFSRNAGEILCGRPQQSDCNGERKVWVNNDIPQHNVYTRAATALKEWIRCRAVLQDEATSSSRIRRNTRSRDTTNRATRKGFIVAASEDYSTGIVFRMSRLYPDRS